MCPRSEIPNIIRALMSAAVLALPPNALARFAENDTDRIDPEERFNTETFNDKASYRFPTIWDSLWDQAEAGYRISAGSLNATRFSILEDIKFVATSSGPVSFSFYHERREDTVEIRLQQMLRIDWLTPMGLNLALLGEGSSEKEFGDLGVAIGFKPGTDRLIEMYHWSVDHFYETKKPFPGDKRLKETATTGLRTDWRFSRQLRLRFDHQYDSPLLWNRESRFYLYSYSKRTTDLRLDLGDEDMVSGYASASVEHKSEGKLFRLPGDMQQEKSLQRRVGVYETAVVHRTGGNTFTTGVQALHRDAEYEFSASEGVEASAYIEKPSPDLSQRRELSFFATSYLKTPSHFNPQYGLHLNQVDIAEGGTDFKATEVKLQTAWDAIISEEARIFLNLTWDLDQLQQDFPFRKKSLSPWGGGNIQFLAVF